MQKITILAKLEINCDDFTCGSCEYRPAIGIFCRLFKKQLKESGIYTGELLRCAECDQAEEREIERNE